MTNQTNLEIVSRRESITARCVIKNNKVTFVYDNENGQVNAVGFSVVRGEQDSQFAESEAFRGSVYGKSFNVDNRNYQMGDASIYEQIYALCQQIITPETTEQTSH